jgi:flavin-dependent thymidylate synthase
MSDQIKVELQESMGNDRSISEAAWTSSIDYQKKKSRTDEDVARVVKMLAEKKHSVPFESVVFRFWMKIPIATDRQLMTHRIASHSGMSGRYRTMPSEFLAMSEDVSDILKKVTYEYDKHRGQEYIDKYFEKCEEANSEYKTLTLDLKEAEKDGLITNQEFKRVREFYRGILPQHNMTERVSVMNLRSFANFYKLRSKPDAQPEIRQVAELMLKAVKEANVCPIAIEWLEKNNWEL